MADPDETFETVLAERVAAMSDQMLVEGLRKLAADVRTDDPGTGMAALATAIVTEAANRLEQGATDG